MLTLKIVQAKYGDCLVVIFGDANSPKYLLIDGGPAGTYQEHLRPELQQIASAGGQLDLLVLSHIDGDHIIGLLDLLEELKENMADGVAPLIAVKELWINTFSATIAKGNQLKNALQHMLANVNNLATTLPAGNLALQSILQGDTLRRGARLLQIPVNNSSGQEIISIETVKESLSVGNISLRIIGPNESNLEKLRSEWLEWIRKNEPNVLSTDIQLLQYIDRSVPNLSSIMFLLESEGKRILFTGDGRGDFILEGLEKTGQLDEKGNIHVDVFKVPHHGSIRNSEADFFNKVTADTYVISADGRHHNPDYETLSWIVKAAQAQKRQITVVCTNRTESSEKLEREFPTATSGYRLLYLEKGAHSLDIKLA